VREKLERENKKTAQEHEEEEHERASSSSGRPSADGKKCKRFRGRFVEPRGVGFTARTGIGRGNERTNGQPEVRNLGARNLRTWNNT
jgi:hypothetical protein